MILGKFRIWIILTLAFTIGNAENKQLEEIRKETTTNLPVSNISDAAMDPANNPGSVVFTNISSDRDTSLHQTLILRADHSEIKSEPNNYKKTSVGTSKSNYLLQISNDSEIQSFDSVSFSNRVEKEFSKSDPFACCKGSLPLCWNEWEWHVPFFR